MVVNVDVSQFSTNWLKPIAPKKHANHVSIFGLRIIEQVADTRGKARQVTLSSLVIHLQLKLELKL